MRRAVVICGLIRAPAHFADYLEGILRLARPDLRVIYSSWTGELARYPEIAALLARLRADVVEQAAPDLTLPGHILHQAAALERGLSVLDDDVFVLKTRPDICGVQDVHEFLDLTPEAAPLGRLAAPFGHRVHVVGMFGAHPAYINDIVFAGMAGDLRRLCFVPFLFGLKYPRLAPEQWLWATVFAPGNPVLDAYLSVNPGLIFDDAPRNAALRAVLVDSPLFACAVAVMAILVRDCLGYFHPDPQRGAVKASCGGYSLEALLWQRLAVAGLDHHPTALNNTFVSVGVMDAVHDGVYAASPLGTRVGAAVARYGGANGRAAMMRDREMLAAEAMDVGVALSALGVGPAGGKAPWTMVETGGYATGLEAEVNHLRRVVDQLQARIARI